MGLAIIEHPVWTQPEPANLDRGWIDWTGCACTVEQILVGGCSCHREEPVRPTDEEEA